MAKFWADILVPIALAGAVAAQTLGVEVNRARRLHAWFPQYSKDTVVQASSADSPLRPQNLPSFRTTPAAIPL